MNNDGSSVENLESVNLPFRIKSIYKQSSFIQSSPIQSSPMQSSIMQSCPIQSSLILVLFSPLLSSRYSPMQSSLILVLFSIHVRITSYCTDNLSRLYLFASIWFLFLKLLLKSFS